MFYEILSFLIDNSSLSNKGIYDIGRGKTYEFIHIWDNIYKYIY